MLSMPGATKEKWLVFADTPLQVFHALHIVDGMATENTSVDLFLYPQFNGAESLEASLRDKGFFSEVLSCPVYAVGNKLKVAVWMLAEYMGQRKLELSCMDGRHYDRVFISCPTAVTYEVVNQARKCSPSLQVFFYEDGLGSYTGNVFRGCYYPDELPHDVAQSKAIWALLKSILRIFKFKNYYKPRAMYLKSPELARFNPSFPLKRLPRTSMQISELIELFGGSSNNNEIREASVMFLDTPRNVTEVSSMAEVIDGCIDSVLNEGLSCCLRTHPRSRQRSVWSSECLSVDGGLWELECGRINEKCLLIGLGSSAQLTPFLEWGISCPLVFLHKLAYSEGTAMYKRIEQVRELAEDCYRSNGRIYSPENAEEFLNLIRNAG